ncbi:hypothetical protein FHS29_004647 [Saccharothrix tamanrassetensis]|uniref:Uncharacterized protein n=1 Tax=Saccharothrix tamanrassetensis TaxID=1051531 RepID=A0A841CL61_9PSEU|nr:hypothetical protein [Saccharothrix tamanrassetensis]MBB5958039.1 hypothetical protein [Saccharothrix tamanrassetensis]
MGLTADRELLGQSGAALTTAAAVLAVVAAAAVVVVVRRITARQSANGFHTPEHVVSDAAVGITAVGLPHQPPAQATAPEHDPRRQRPE